MTSTRDTRGFGLDDGSVDSAAIWGDAWLRDFQHCLDGDHGPAWRARAEKELRRARVDPDRARVWAGVRQEILSPDAA